MDSRLEKGPVCGVENCRSRWYEEGEDGFRYCQNGHQQFGLVRAADDDDDFTLATTTRTRKKKDTDDQVKLAKHFSGRQGLDLYLKSLQLILRHQLRFLIKEKALPEELELITLELWALRIAQFGDRIASDSRTDSQSQSQVFSTLETDDEETDDARGTFRTPKGRDKKLSRVPNLLDALALCYLGILTLRLPITPGDIYHWVTEEKLAYRGAIKLLPLPMRDRLPPTYHATLNPNALLKYKRFYAVVTDTQVSFTSDHKIKWPPLNHHLLVFRYLKELALPLEVYDYTLRLCRLLGYNFVLHQDGNKRLGVRHLPEAQLAGCLIICVRLLYPFDGEKRHPRLASEPTSAVMNWASWWEQIQAARAQSEGGNGRFTIEKLTKLEEKDAFEMAPEQLDQYLDFYADTFLDDAEIQRTKDTDDFRNAIYNMFPIEGASTATAPNADKVSKHDDLVTVRAVHSSMQTRLAIPDDEVGTGVLRPGRSFRVYKREQDLPEAARAFFEAVAKLAGLSMDMIMLAVSSMEARIEKCRRKQREGAKSGLDEQ
ncbi:Pol I core factor CF [Didymella heteroderae]|uniref:Pol I core factor CF n=1 Tax=Didymella heteroderae TaxID=1769908 RepID=A0A9P5C1X6_9PLEO|nr:Pol I core factor CF [Didymella heteroderae]